MHLERLCREVPRMIDRGIELLRAESFPQIDDVVAASGTTKIDFEGEGEQCFVLENGAVRVEGVASAALPRPHFVLSMRSEAVDFALSTVQLLVADAKSLSLKIDFEHPTDDMARALATTLSAAVAELVQPFQFAGRLVVRDVPDHGDLQLDFGLNMLALSAPPKFTLQVFYDDLDDVRHGEMTRDQLIGRLRIQGDASQALQLGAKLSKWAQKNRPIPA